MAYHKILVAIDGSEFSEPALQQIRLLADKDTEVSVLSVLIINTQAVIDMVNIGSSLGMTFMPASEIQALNDQLQDPRVIADREDYLSKATHELSQAGYAISVKAIPGDPVETILKTAAADYDLIVMASHGRTGLARLTIGSVAESVLRRAPCPVLIVPIHLSPATQPSPLTNGIVVAA